MPSSVIAPAATIIAPEMLDTACNLPLRPRMMREAEPSARAKNMNGTASPRLYTVNSQAEWATLCWDAAIVKIEPRIGPTHGDQPAPNVTPIKNDETSRPDSALVI